MLEIAIFIGAEGWDEEKEEFLPAPVQVLHLEHSLVSLRNWEAKWQKPFLSRESKTDEEALDYIRLMTLDPGVDPVIYNHLSAENIDAINKYIDSPMTATTFTEDKNGRRSREIITAEILYYWMIALNIPFECQYWHLNSLLSLIKVCNIKNQPPKKMSKKDIMSRNARLNAARRQQLNSKG